MTFWDDVRAHHVRNAGRQLRLERLNAWRNAIAHQDFTAVPPLDHTGRVVLRKADIDAWRSACGGLALSFDAVVGAFVTGMVGAAAW